MSLKIDGLGAALAGLQRAEKQAAKATSDVNASFVAAQNALAADSVNVSDKAAVAPAVEDAVRGAALSADGPDLSAALVSLLQTKTAYEASLKSATVTGDLQTELVRQLGKDA